MPKDMPLKNFTQMPPGGYFYEQADATGKAIKRFHSNTMPFVPFCNDVLRLRTANKLPRATAQETREDVEEANCQRLGYDPRWVEKKTEHLPTRLFRAASKRVRDAATRYSSGAKTLYDWMDKGFVAVPREVAQARAGICLRSDNGNPCPFNRIPTIKIPDALERIIHQQVEKKNGMKVTVAGEEGLQVCRVCACFLKLKVHVPLDTLLSQMTDETISKFKAEYPACWINTEQNPAT